MTEGLAVTHWRHPTITDDSWFPDNAETMIVVLRLFVEGTNNSYGMPRVTKNS